MRRSTRRDTRADLINCSAAAADVIDGGASNDPLSLIRGDANFVTECKDVYLYTPIPLMLL